MRVAEKEGTQFQEDIILCKLRDWGYADHHYTLMKQHVLIQNPSELEMKFDITVQ